MNHECCDKYHWNKAEGRFDTRQRLKGEEEANLERDLFDVSIVRWAELTREIS